MGIVRYIRSVEATQEPTPGWLPPGAAEPRPTGALVDLDIVEEDPGIFFLISHTRRTEAGGAVVESWGDTVHDSLEAAFHQAEFWWGIKPEDWSEGFPGDR